MPGSRCSQRRDGTMEPLMPRDPDGERQYAPVSLSGSPHQPIAAVYIRVIAPVVEVVKDCRTLSFDHHLIVFSLLLSHPDARFGPWPQALDHGGSLSLRVRPHDCPFEPQGCQHPLPMPPVPCGLLASGLIEPASYGLLSRIRQRPDNDTAPYRQNVDQGSPLPRCISRSSPSPPPLPSATTA